MMVQKLLPLLYLVAATYQCKKGELMKEGLLVLINALIAVDKSTVQRLEQEIAEAAQSGGSIEYDNGYFILSTT